MVVPGERTVLVVDDEPTIRENLERLLKTEGYEVVVAADGHEALERTGNQEFAVVLLDIGLQGLSGLDVLRKLRVDWPETCVIMITATSAVETAVEAMKLGAYDYLIKPFNLDDILIRVEKARERRYLAFQVKDYQRNLEQRVAQQAEELRQSTRRVVERLLHDEVAERELETGSGGRQGAAPGTEVKQFGAKILGWLSRRQV